jgi:nucleoid-associated protein YgaU
MGKEVKIGLTVIGVLLCVLGGVLFYRLRREQPATPQQKVAAAKKEGKVKSAKKKEVNPDKPGEDRYGRLTAQAARNAPGDGGLQTVTGEVNQAEPPTIESSPYRNRPTGDRYGRYGDAATVESDDTDDNATDEADETGSEVAMPEDRFAQPPGGLAFSDDDAEDEADVSTGHNDDAAQLSIDRTDRFGSAGETVESNLDEPSDALEADTGAVRLTPLAEDESEVRPAGNNRLTQRRYEADQLDRGTMQDAEEMVDEDEPTVNEAVDESARPFRRRPESDSYVVEPNDNFWRISQKVYGTGAYFKALEEHNRRQYGERALINVGDAVSAPPLAVLREKYPDLCPKPRNAPLARGEMSLTSSPVRGSRTYNVAEGDTLFDIARQELGKASRWAEIYQLNRDQLGEDFNYLSPGMQLLLPERDAASGPIASRPQRDGYRR